MAGSARSAVRSPTRGRTSMRILAETAERSIVTVLAVDTVNSTDHIAGDDPDDAQELLDRIYEHLDGSIRRAGCIGLPRNRSRSEQSRVLSFMDAQLSADSRST